MDYSQAREFIEKARQYGSVYSLDGIRGLMCRLGNVQDKLSVLHVAGTNGKGSVCAMLAGILQAAGLRVGLYSSPAVFVPEEIIKVNGKNIPQEDFAAAVQDVCMACAGMLQDGLMHPTAFEIETAAAFCYFYRERCDFVVLETGLGGGLDATNLISEPACSIFTSISRDHTAILGESLAEIAAVKAGIVKPGCPCVSAVQHPEVMEVLQKAAQAAGSIIHTPENFITVREFGYDGRESTFCAAWQGEDGPKQLSGTFPLPGACQRSNLECVLTVISVLRGKGMCISGQAILDGLSNISLPGRLERIFKEPDFYIDGCHNEGAALFLRETAQNCFTKRPIVYIIGVLADKEYGKVLRIMLPYADKVFTVTPDNPRALNGQELACHARRLGADAVYVADMPKAAMLAIEEAGPGGIVLAFGSFSYLGELKQAVKGRICRI